jgi:hypothetical protein
MTSMTGDAISAFVGTALGVNMGLGCPFIRPFAWTD